MSGRGDRLDGRVEFHGSNVMPMQSLETGQIYLHLYHGRHTVNEHLDDWGFEGPTIGPLEYVHVTYMCDVKFSAPPHVMDQFFPEVISEWRAKGYSNAADPLCDWQLNIVEDLIEYRGKFYGDWSVFIADLEPDPVVTAPAPARTRAPVVSAAIHQNDNVDSVGEPLPIRTLPACAYRFLLPPANAVAQQPNRAG